MTESTPTEPVESTETPAAEPKVDRQTLLDQIAGRLVSARKASGQSVEEVMRDLKLRRIYLEALESGDWDALPGQVYALGFLRQYAAHLHLDLEKEIDLLKDGQYQLTKPLTYPDPPIAPSRKWAMIAGVAFVVLLILFNLSGHDEPHEPVPPFVSSEPEPAPAPTQDNLSPMTEPSGETAAQATAPETIAPVSPAEPEVATTVPSAATAGMPLHLVDLAAVESEVWLEIYLPDAEGNPGELVKQQLLQAGEHLLLNSADPVLLITCGNAAGLQISVDGEERVTAGSLGKPGRVVRNYRLQTEKPQPTQSDLSD